MYDERASTPEGRASLAAAEAAIQVQALIERAFASDEVSLRQVGRGMGVTDGRVSQLRHSDGNLRVSTLARLMEALGYSLTITGQPHRTRHAPLHASHSKQVWVQRFLSSTGVHECEYVGDDVPREATPVGEPIERSQVREAAWVRHARDIRAEAGRSLQAVGSS
ncbi:hypothetical protein [Nostocoides australiense]